MSRRKGLVQVLELGLLGVVVVGGIAVVYTLVSTAGTLGSGLAAGLTSGISSAWSSLSSYGATLWTFTPFAAAETEYNAASSAASSAYQTVQSAGATLYDDVAGAGTSIEDALGAAWEEV